MSVHALDSIAIGDRGIGDGGISDGGCCGGCRGQCLHEKTEELPFGGKVQDFAALHIFNCNAPIRICVVALKSY